MTICDPEIIIAIAFGIMSTLLAFGALAIAILQWRTAIRLNQSHDPT